MTNFCIKQLVVNRFIWKETSDDVDAINHCDTTIAAKENQTD